MKNFDNRADAEVVGHVIVLGITILGVSMIALYGIPAISSLQDMANLKNTEQAFTVLDSRASRSALGEAPRQITDFTLSGGYISTIPNSSSNPSYILIEIGNSTTVFSSFSIPMGKIVYKLGEREVAYEGGGVWSKYPSASVMLSPPEFHYNGETLTLPVVNITGSYSMGGKGTVALNIEKKGNPNVIYPNATNKNPIPENATYVNITIYSTYYDGWASYFRSIPLTNIYSDANKKNVTVKLETPPASFNFLYGLLGSDKIELKQNAVIDSYNSLNGNYTQTKSGNGSVRANTQIKLKNNAKVNGSALSAGSIDGSGCGGGGNNCIITKDAYGSSVNGVKVNGATYLNPAEVMSVPSAASLVTEKIGTFKSPNNNSVSTCLSGASKTELVDTCTIYGGTGSAGYYYLTKFELDTNEDLILDTTSGPISIAVDADITIKKANITVIPTIGSPVKIYLNGGMTVDTTGARVNRNTNDNSSRFQIFSGSNEEIKFENTIEFCGSVYAPDSEIKIKNNAAIYGALVGKLFKVENSQSIHFDEALQNVGTGVAEGTNIMYLYITRNDLGVSIS